MSIPLHRVSLQDFLHHNVQQDGSTNHKASICSSLWITPQPTMIFLLVYYIQSIQ